MNEHERAHRQTQLRRERAAVRPCAAVCEVGDMEKVLTELDANFLMAAALGYSCLVYDFGSRDRKREAPRALWYGLEFVRFALNSLWFGAPVGMTSSGFRV